MTPRFSIVVPVYRESAGINALVAHLRGLDLADTSEIIVVDGDPGGGTIGSIEYPGVRKLINRKGRGAQMNAGAEVAAGSILVFSHADTKMPEGAGERIAECLSRPGVVVGAFDLGIDSERRAYRPIEWMVSIRTRLTSIPYGDQAIFVRRTHFLEIGGFREIPIMEDVELMQRLKRTGGKIAIIPEKVLTSPRRWERDGIVFCTLRNWLLITLYLAGISPYRLARFYR